MTDLEIMNEFGALFGEGETPENEPESEETETSTETEVEESDNSQEDETTETGTEEESDNSQEQNRNDKANYAFAEMRTKNKKQENLIRGLGKLIGLDDNTDVDKIADSLQDFVIKKQAEKSGIPEETLKEIEELRALVNENNQLKIERETQEAFINLSKKYEIDSEGMREFAQYLVDNDMNPLSGATVDVESEYIKLHFADMIEAAFNRGAEQEKARKQKAENHAGTPVPGSGQGEDSKPEKIDSVNDLERYFNSLDL